VSVTITMESVALDCIEVLEATDRERTSVLAGRIIDRAPSFLPLAPGARCPT
jgi:hypothetical protein